LETVRLWYWLGGLIVVAILAVALQAHAAGSDWQPFALFLLWGCLGIAGELVALIRGLSAPRVGDHSRDHRAADGTVEVASMSGVVGTPNLFARPYQRFESFEPSESLTCAGPVGDRTCPPLLGRVVWTSMFIGCDGRPWLDHEIAETHAALTKAGTWLEQQAIHLGATVNIELADTYFLAQDDTLDDVEVALITHGDRYAPADSREPEKLLITASRAAAALGFQDAVDWLLATRTRVPADVHVWLVHLRRAGCSQVVTEHDTGAGTIRLAVCYAREGLYPEPLSKVPYSDPVTIVHEVLHLFGATDKYEVPLRSFAPGTVTSQDVMRLKESRLQRLRIDPPTAAEIGWAQKNRPPQS
jgi:hypothetical protein